MALPNIVFLLMDSARADRMATNGYERPTTPCLEQLAGRGVVFEQAVSAAPWTIPSHASFFTGRFPSEHGAHRHHLRKDVGPLLAEQLAEAGYLTIAMINNTLLHPDSGLARGFEIFHRVLEDPARIRGPKQARNLAWGLGWRDSGAALTNQRIFEALEHAPAPFFLFVNYMETHSPFLPPPRFRKRFAPCGLRVWRPLQLAWQFRDPRFWALLKREDAGVLQLLSDLYDGELAYLDWRIGEVLDWLDNKQLLNSTIIIITSDHGENLGDHGLLSHHLCLYDTLVHIPLIICWPGRLPEAHRYDRHISSTDLYPSICKALGLSFSIPERPGPPRPHLLDWDALRQADAPAYCEYVPPRHVPVSAQRFAGVDLGRHVRTLWAVRTGQHKYIEGPNDWRELYDLSADPQELRNVAASDCARAEELHEQAALWRKNLGPLGDEADETASEEVITRLRSLGYM